MCSGILALQGWVPQRGWLTAGCGTSFACSLLQSFVYWILELYITQKVAHLPGCQPCRTVHGPGWGLREEGWCYFKKQLVLSSKRNISMYERTRNLSLNTLGAYLLILHHFPASSGFQVFCICFCSFPVMNVMLLVGAVSHPHTLQRSLCPGGSAWAGADLPALPAKPASGFS